MLHNLDQKQSWAAARARENVRRLFFLWEFLSTEGLQDDAREYLAEHEDEVIPFELMM